MALAPVQIGLSVRNGAAPWLNAGLAGEDLTGRVVEAKNAFVSQ